MLRVGWFSWCLRLQRHAAGEIKKLLESPIHEVRTGAVSIRDRNHCWSIASSIYLKSARDPARLIREVGLQIELAEGSRYVSVLPSGRSGPNQVITANTSTSIDEALTELMELRSTMNITRRWAARGPLAPGTYRLSLVYYGSRDTQRPPVTIYSPTFEVQ